MRLIGVLLAGALGLVGAQTETVFEVESVKLSDARSVRGSNGGPGSSDPGRYTFEMATMQDLVATAYHVDYFQIASKVPLDQQKFDVAVSLPKGTTRPQFRVMMQNLLAERFHLKMHMESREFPAFELVVARTGLKLKESAAGDGSSSTPSREPEDGYPELPPNKPGLSSRMSTSGDYILVRTRAQQVSMSQLAQALHPQEDRPIVDKTGLTGRYDFKFEYTLEQATAARDTPPQPPVAPNLLNALPQQLGLQLVAKKMPFDVVVVESIEKLPTEN